MKILLIYPQWTKGYGLSGYFARRSSTWMPLNLAIIGAIAQQEGHQVKIIDGEADRLDVQEIQHIVQEYKPQLIGMTATTPFFHKVVEVAEAIKRVRSGTRIMLGGVHITIMQEKAFFDCFDFAILGEGENVSKNIFTNYPDIDTKMKGMMFRSKGKIINTGIADPVDIDDVPLPARHLLPMHKYKLGTIQGRKNFTTIMTMRGCPFSCIFCANKLFGKSIRRRDPMLVRMEILQVVQDYGIRHFMFIDDTLTIDRDYVFELFQGMESFGITFEGSTRANLIDEEMVMMLAKAGMIRISFGLETVNAEIRRIIKKEVPIDCYTTANRLTRKYGIETLNSVMLGLPNETRKTINETLEFLEQSKEIQQANFAIATPYVGTEMYDMARRGDYGLKIVDDDFSHYKRYGSAVMASDKLSQQDLLDLQDEGYARIYSKAWRIIPMIKKSGIIGGLITLWKVIKYQIRKRGW